MELQQDSKKIIIAEFDYVINKLSENIPFDEKLFYFSALHGVVNRVMNNDATQDLIYLHHILYFVFSNFNARIQAMKSDDLIVKIDDNIISKLTQYTIELSENISSDKPLDDIYRKLIVLAYITTGNGYYLYKRQRINL